jgi:hypothetical protein
MEKFDEKKFIESINSLGKKFSNDKVEVESDEEEIQDYSINTDCYNITFIEFAIINEYLYSVFRNKSDDLTINSYGTIGSGGMISFGTSFNVANDFWFNGHFKDDENEYIFQTKMYLDNRKNMTTEFNLTSKNGTHYQKLMDVFNKIKSLAFNNSKYTGKCIKVKIKDGSFMGIEIIDISNFSTELILSETQEKFINHFINRVKRGGVARYLLNGEPGTGKTESIRDIIRQLMPNVTFIIPDFSTGEDLTIILEACEIFNNAVIIMDDIDLYLGSRDTGHYTALLGQFLSFFDGVKKRKISLLASTNDKGLVDKAAERPGRFNMTLDYTFLNSEQIVKVCQIHLPKKYQISEIYDVLTGTINGKKVNVTGAFIANLSENIKEMSEDEDTWDVEDTVSLIKESYKGFYMSQVEKENNIGFKIN